MTIINRLSRIVVLGALLSLGFTATALADNKGVITGDRVNIRTAASLDSAVLTRLNTGNTVGVVSKEGDFYKLSGDYDGAYVSIMYLNIVCTEGIFRENDVGIRTSPSEESEILAYGSIGDPAEITGIRDNWYIINYNGQDAFVSKDLLLGHNLADFMTEKASSAGTIQLSPDGSISNTQEIIDYAKQFLGTPYVYAGSNLTKGVDCSGFVYSVMKHFGITLSRSSSAQSKDGAVISKNELAAGDLVFFDTNGGANNGRISHVGIYIGNGQFIHSSSSTKTWGVTISSLEEDYYKRNYVSACRILS